MKTLETTMRARAFATALALIVAFGIAVASPCTQSASATETNAATPGIAANSAPEPLDLVDEGTGEPAVAEPSLAYATHRQNAGWSKPVKAPKQSGSTTRNRSIDAFKVAFNPGTYQGGIAYRSHLSKSGWQSWKQGGGVSGKISKKARLDAIAIKLIGPLAKTHVVVYRVYAETHGWLPWVTEGVKAGKADGKRIMAIEAQIVKRPARPQAKQTVRDGLYSLSPTASPSLRVSPSTSSTKTSSKVALARSTAYQLEQAWKITWKGNGYEIMNAYSGRILDASDAARNCLAGVKLQKRTSANTQRWAIEKVSGGYQLAAMTSGTVLAATGRQLKTGRSLALALPGSPFPHALKLRTALVLPTGSIRLFSKLGRTRYCAAMPDLSLSTGTQACLARSNDTISERFIIAKDDHYFTIQAPCSGKYLTAQGGAVVQKPRSKSKAQRWQATVSNAGGLQLVNAANGKVLSVKTASKKAGSKLVLGAPSNENARIWFASKATLVPAGLYELRVRNAANLRLDVCNFSIRPGANAMLYKRTNANNQKFAILPASGSYCRIKMALGNTVLAVAKGSSKSGANVRFERWRNSAAQLWKPAVTDSGITFVNKKSGKCLSFEKARSGSNVRQSSGNKSNNLTSWVLAETNVNGRDEHSLRIAINAAPSSGLKVANVSGYHVSGKLLARLNDAISGCRSRGADISFIMVDLGTGATVSLNPDRVRFGASTIKGLYVTYLFEEYLEKGRLSWKSIAALAWPTIVHSSNSAYRSLRARFGNKAGFRSWLASAGVGYIGTWGNYSARTLARAWTHMAGYAASNGRYVGQWKSLFNHSDHSFIHEAIGGSKSTYSKPGWMEAGAWCGTIMNDAAIVEGHRGGRYLVAFTSTINPSTSRWVIGRVASALDAIHNDMSLRYAASS